MSVAVEEQDQTKEQGPWNDYAAPQAAEKGPWEDYAQPSTQPKKTDFETKTDPKGPDRGYASGVGAGEIVKSAARRLVTPGFVDPYGDYSAVKTLTHPKQNYEAAKSSMDETLASQSEFDKYPGGSLVRKALPYAAGALGVVAPAVGVDPVSQRNRAERGDTAGILGENTIPALSAVAPLAHEALGHTTPNRSATSIKTEKAGNMLRRAVTPNGMSVADEPRFNEMTSALQRNIGPYVRATPIEKGPGGAKVAADMTRQAAQNIWSERVEPVIENHAEVQRPISDVGQKIRSAAKPANAELENNAIAKYADRFEGSWSVRQIADEIRELNNNKAVGKFMSAEPQEQAAMLGADPALRGKVQGLSALKEKLFDVVGEEGGESANADFQRARKDWGLLSEAEGHINGARIPNPEPLGVRLMNSIRGAITPGGGHIRMNPEGLFNLEHPNRLIPKAFNLMGEVPAENPEPVRRLTPFEKMPPANRLLPPPRTELGGPGTAELAHPEMFPERNPGVPAPSTVQRGAGGRMQRVYKGEMPPAVVGQTAEGGLMHEGQPPAPRRAERPTERRQAAPSGYQGVERRSLTDILSNTEELTQQINHWKKVERDPKSTPRDKEIARSMIDDLRSNNFKGAKGELGETDVNRIKAKNQPLMSREDAESATERRKEGRTKRFREKRND